MYFFPSTDFQHSVLPKHMQSSLGFPCSLAVWFTYQILFFLHNEEVLSHTCDGLALFAAFLTVMRASHFKNTVMQSLLKETTMNSLCALPSKACFFNLIFKTASPHKEIIICWRTIEIPVGNHLLFYSNQCCRTKYKIYKRKLSGS